MTPYRDPDNQNQHPGNWRPTATADPLAAFAPKDSAGNIGALYSPEPISPEPVGLKRGTSAGTGYDAMQLERVAMLRTSQPWLPPQATFALATAGMPEDHMMATAEGLRQAVAKIDDGFKLLTDDPVLEKQQSLGLAITRYINQTLGPVPVQETDLTEIQKNLKEQGFGRELKADGIWSPSWNAAYRQWSDRLVRNQLAGKQPGGWTVGHALEAMGSVLPVKAGNALIGFAKSIPHDVRQLAADLVNGVTELGGQVTVPFGVSEKDLSRSATTAGGFVAGQTPEEFQRASFGKTFEQIHEHPEPGKEMTHVLGRTVEDVGTVLLLDSFLKVGTNFAKAAGADLFKATAEQNAAAAARGPGVIARSLGAGWGATGARGVAARAAIGGTGAGIATAASGGDTRDIVRNVAIAAGLSGVVGTRAFAQIPVLGNTGPILGKLASEDGFYYRARTLLASPYKLPAVRVAADAVGKAGILGAEARGVAVVAGLNPASTLAHNVQEERTLDAVDDAVRHAQREAFGRDVSLGLDDLVFLLHPVEGISRPSDLVGDQVKGVVDGVEAALGRTGILAQIERGTGKLYPDLVAEAGGKERFLSHWTYNVMDHAAWHYAERQLDLLPEGRDLTGLARINELRAFHDEAWQDSSKLKRSLEEMIHGTDHTANPYELAGRITRQISNAQVAGGSADIGVGDRLSGFIDASDVLRTSVVPREATIPQVDAAKRNFRAANPDAHPFAEPMVALGDKDHLVQHEALAQVHRFWDRAHVAATEGDVDKIRALESTVGEFLFNEFGVDARRMPHTIDEKLKLAEHYANLLAEQVFISADADPALKTAFAKIEDKGYRVVVGRGGIGLRYRGLHPLDEVGEGGLTARRRLVERFGLSPTRVPDIAPGTVRRQAIRSELERAINEGKIQRPPYWTPDTILAYLQNKEAVTFEPRRVEGALMSLFGVPRKRTVEALAEGLTDLPKADARRLARARAQEEATSVLALRDMPRSQVIELLTQPTEKVNRAWVEQAIAAGLDPNDVEEVGKLPLFSKEDAGYIYRTILSGSAAAKSSMLGATRVEDFVRAGFGFAGSKLPNAEFWNRVTTIPNDIIRLRNDLRFRLSPYFSLRRVAKTNVKLVLEDVTPVLDPLGRMVKAGTLDKNLAELDRLLPKFADKGYDDASKFLYENDVFGIYNHRHYEAYAVGQWKQQGKTDDEIRKLLTKVFGYGSREGQGRSAAERTANFIFFPFSFDKTLYRNTGGYLLDHPGQMVLLTRALEAYKHFNDDHLNGQNPLAASWMERHLPLLQEVDRLNAFAHGISAGEFGGINRPLLNLFLPQSWDFSDPKAQSALKRFVPALKDFQRVMQEGQDTYGIAKTVIGNEILAHLFGSDTPKQLKPVAISPEAQREEAYLAAQETYSKYKDILYWNAHHSGDNRYRFPNRPKLVGKLVGEPITKTNILRLLKMKYPAISITEPAKIADDKRAELADYELSLKGSPHEREYKAFIDHATTAARYIFDDKYTVDQAQYETDKVRHFAAALSRDDPRFYAMYRRHFARFYGPLERV